MSPLFSDIADTWLEVLLDVIAYLPKDIIKRDVSNHQTFMSIIALNT